LARLQERAAAFPDRRLVVAADRVYGGRRARKPLPVNVRHVRYPERPWYRAKQEPSCADILSTLRRVSGEEFVAGARGDRQCEEAVLA
jgi:hypothetical protein